VTVHGASGARPLVQTSSSVGVRVAAGATLRDVTIRQLNINGVALVIAGGTAERIHSRTDGDWGCELLAGAVIRDSICFTTTTDTNDGAGLFAFHADPTSVNVTVRNVTAVASEPGVPGRKALPLNGSAVLNVLATNVIAKAGSGPDVTTATTAGQAHIVLGHSNYATESEGSVVHSITDPGTGTNRIGNVAFKDAAAGDFRQTGTSTGTIDLGVAGVVNGVDLGTADVDGETRTAGPLPDIGADEGGIPDAPLVTSIDPANTADTLTPKVQGTAAGSTDVHIFTNDACTGIPVATGTTALFEGAGIEVTVLPGSQTTFWARALRDVFTSDCSSVRSPGPGASQAYTVVPTPPVLLTTDPPSPADENSPRIIGTARSDTNTVQIYDDEADYEPPPRYPRPPTNSVGCSRTSPPTRPLRWRQRPPWPSPQPARWSPAWDRGRG